jgi:quercetin dioxygenase-like cupin family protein
VAENNIEKLEELTKRIHFETTERTRYFEVATDGAPLIGFTLFKNKSVAIVRVFGEEGTCVPFHVHPGTERFGVYSGKVKVKTSKGEEFVIEKGQQIQLLGEYDHDCFFIEDSWCWSITVPPEDFPS